MTAVLFEPTRDLAAPGAASNPTYEGTPLEAIDWGTRLDLPDGVVRAYFVEAGQTISLSEEFDNEVHTAQRLTDAQIAGFRAAFDQYEAFLDITFEIVSDPDEANFAIYKSNEVGRYAFMNPPGTLDAGIGAFHPATFAPAAGGVEPGALGFNIIVHELGHALGLAHPHDDGGASDVLYGVGNPREGGWLGLNQGVHTTMSYHFGYPLGPDGKTPTNDFGLTKTSSPWDIAVLQDKYGANMETGAGDDVYHLPRINTAGTGYVAIWDAGGHDAIVAGGRVGAVIDLNAATLQYEIGGGGIVSHTTGIHGGFTIAAGVVIEDATGARGNDTITGNDVANSLAGRGGDDVINGLGGRDTIAGGGGNDTLTGAAGADSIDGNAGNDHILGNGGTDWLSGGAGDDALSGGGGRDTLFGNAGNDTLSGGAGHDLLKGGIGKDVMFGSGGNDTLVGGSGDDWMVGDDGADVLRGDAGNDNLLGLRGADELSGGSGRDTVSGGNGDDTLDGGSGRDLLLGGHGDDILTGGSGADRFGFEAHGGADIVTDFAVGVDRIDVTPFETGFEALMDAAQDTAEGVLLTLDQWTSALLEGVASGDLGEGDFLF